MPKVFASPRLARSFLAALGLAALGLGATSLDARESDEASTAKATTPAMEESWYQVAVGNEPAGYLVMREIVTEETRTSETDLRLTFSRGGNAQSIGIASRFVETPEHEPVSLWTRQSLGALPMETTYTFGEDGVTIEGPSGTRTVESPPGDWQTPLETEALLDREIDRLLADPEGVGKSIETTVLDPSLGIQPVTVTYTLEDRDDPVRIEGEERPASRWRQTQSYAPQMASTVHLAEDGTNLRSVTSVMGLEMTVTLGSRESVLAARGAPELLVQTFLYPDRPIRDPRSLRRAVYRLTAEGDEPLPPLPETAVQRVATAEDGARIVTVDLALGEPKDEAESESIDRDLHLRSTAYLGHASDALRALHAEAVADVVQDAAPAERAEALRRFVAGHLAEKNLDSVLATAEQAAEQRAGDCTEHAVLLAALLRADGIPSRVATGLVYVDAFAGKRELFAYHMWTQAFVDGRWLDLDATLDAVGLDEVGFDAAHLTFGTSALDDDGSALLDMAGVAPLVGRLDLEIVEIGKR